MRNVYPANEVGEVMDDLATAKASSIENLAPNGIGWTEVHAIKEPENSYRDLGIDVPRVSTAIEKILPRIREFEVGFGANNPFHHKDEDAQCFGFGQNLYLKLEVDGDFVNAIWFDTTSGDEDQMLALRRALEVLDDLHPAMIADYWLNTGGLIGDPAFMDGYFDQLRSTVPPPAAPASQSQETTARTWWAKLISRLSGGQ